MNVGEADDIERWQEEGVMNVRFWLRHGHHLKNTDYGGAFVWKVMCSSEYVTCVIVISVEWFHPIQELRNVHLLLYGSNVPHVKACFYSILTRADYLFIQNYIRSVLNIILRPILMFLLSIYVYIYIYIYTRNIIIKYTLIRR